MTFRKFEEKDILDIELCLQEAFSLPSTEKEVLEKFMKENLLYVVESEGNVIGCATLHLQQKLIRNGGVVGFIEEVAVKSSHRGKRVGEFMIKNMIEEAKELGCYKVILSCKEERVAFYERCGMHKDCYTMRIDLKS